MEIPIKINLPDQGKVELGQSLENVIVTESGVKVRPGSYLFVDTGTDETVYTYDWEEQGYVIAISDGNVYSVIPDDTDFFEELATEADETLLAGDGTPLLVELGLTSTDLTDDTTGSHPPTFADFGDYLFIATGGKIIELHAEAAKVTHSSVNYTCIKNCIDIEPGVDSGWETYWSASGTGGDDWSEYSRYGSGFTNYIEDTSAPTDVEWIGVADKYLLALEKDSQRMHFSVVLEPWSWDSDWVSAEFLPDDATCLMVVDGEIWIGGRRSLQNFINNGSTPWVPSSYGAITTGILAPRSFTSINGNFYFLDDTRRLVTVQNRVATSVNHTLDSYLNTLPSVTDAEAYYSVIDGLQFYIIRFPSENKTIALNIDLGSWSLWTSDGESWLARSVTYVPLWDTTIIGTDHGTIEQLSGNYNSESSTEIYALIRSPRFQTYLRVVPSMLTVGLTRVESTNDGDAELRIRWRDDGKKWGGYRTITVDDTKTDHVEQLHRIGSYRNNRQYEFDCSGLHPYAIQRVDQI